MKLGNIFLSACVCTAFVFSNDISDTHGSDGNHDEAQIVTQTKVIENSGKYMKSIVFGHNYLSVKAICYSSVLVCIGVSSVVCGFVINNLTITKYMLSGCGAALITLWMLRPIVYKPEGEQKAVGLATKEAHD